ncbi:cathepsin O [Engraulis encrasicolus]|uniref:cathepsin O n=1 Tax=Engraulis encrasicolus TaxID=184585 RepID=UPI002FD31B02
MERLVVLVLLLYQRLDVTTAFHLSLGEHEGTESKYNASTEFALFKERFQSKYSPEEFLRRAINFENSLKRHTVLNAPSEHRNCSARYGVNQFSHLSPQEFRELYLNAQAEPVAQYYNSRQNQTRHVGRELPTRFDWRDEGKVGPVQNQGSCGGCWAFSIVGAIESAQAKDGGSLEELSVQQVIDCSYKDQGCDGGSTIRALGWLRETQVKLVKKSHYPYKGTSGICHYFDHSEYGVSVTNFEAYDFSEEEELMKQWLVDYGPLVVTVDAVSWQDYLGGIIQHHCSSHYANHAVQVIGYDTTGDVPYWIVRNSWGASWGIDGYVHIRIGSNLCGIADTVAAVFV